MIQFGFVFDKEMLCAVNYNLGHRIFLNIRVGPYKHGVSTHVEVFERFFCRKDFEIEYICYINYIILLYFLLLSHHKIFTWLNVYMKKNELLS